MSKISLYEPAMCCDTGVCGPGVDTELLRMSSVVQTLENTDDVEVERFNLTNNPGAFVENAKIGELLQTKGAEILPVVLLDDEIVKMAGYPSNDEFTVYTGVNFSEEKQEKQENSCCSPSSGCC
ncbi:MAG: arsenite efflux transporter metallochaperone ArsD [Tetragenococcus halophilus]|uniref:Arsenical resistance operon transcriptional repressor ArsD n=1 Tax=Tetragenococcus halophilus TaxID=51669 RepID=A0A3G5FHX6_TETHA|nr:arsenite efflux transporter metallochaperone ArsD [Tetragenococcus halophilus]AYW49932.1 arsenical resistance operon transcriptional repressor ArsD [Tetragenococcus halophilus]MCO8288692.1 arsenite efflux transporter metallochaperone ArsD [Tetragenococcus halophilus]MCO8288699.1 arsenite efflux transporter metallochaperone ArsD [Tetragenococcus halophilus]MDN6112261.1 arsenite efflux transporter metallochaperone ArsD [Tetragenococcus halophilus]MDN6129479.1 arsenite efflux transporter metal